MQNIQIMEGQVGYIKVLRNKTVIRYIILNEYIVQII